MKKGSLNFLGRKNQSLFDTNIKIKDMDNMELVLGSSAIPESGTASVRARPTVKHHASSSESFQGFNVPTPKVPLLPPVSGPKINGSVGGHHLSNGSVISMHDPVEGEILVPPPPPGMAPPPPPLAFIPPPDFMGDLSSLQPPSLPAPKVAPSMGVEDLTFLQPPPMAPPKPPSTCSSGSGSSVPISSTPTATVPERPKFAPPQPPSERQQITFKTPPPKPIRLSSISNFDSPPQSPAPPPPVQTPTLSTFNPQNTAKLYNVPTTSILSGYEDRDTKPKQMLLLEDSGSVKSPQMVAQVDGKAPKVTTPSTVTTPSKVTTPSAVTTPPKVTTPSAVTTPSKVTTPPKPLSKDVQELKENLQITQPPLFPPPEPNKEAKTVTVSAPPEIEKPLRIPHQTSPQLPKLNKPWVNSESKLEGSASHGRKFSPLIDRKLRSLKSSETNGGRDGPAASPMALLKAAKERDKHRSTHSLSRENSGKKNEQPGASIHPSESNPNSFIVTPRSSSSSSPTSQDILQESPKSVSPEAHSQTIQTPEKSSSPAPVKDQMPSISPAFSRMSASTSVTNLVEQKRSAEPSPPKSQSAQHKDNKQELNIPFLPPPPEFGDFDDIVGPPPSIPPPDPPMKKAPTPIPTVSPPAPPPPPAQVPPPPPKPKPPAAPKLPPPDLDVKPKLQVPTKPKAAPSQLPPNLSSSQATLLSILQKKMLEMDHKMAPAKEAESTSDDWGSPLSDEENKVPVVPRITPQSKNYPAVVNKATTLDMRELEGKVVGKYKDTSSVRVPTSNGVQSKHQYGMTFTVRPGTKQPITLVRKGES